jgi:hypothetical protein
VNEIKFALISWQNMSLDPPIDPLLKFQVFLAYLVVPYILSGAALLTELIQKFSWIASD